MTAAAAWILTVGVLLGPTAGSPPVLEPQVVDSDSVLLELDPNRGDRVCVVLLVSVSAAGIAPHQTIPGVYLDLLIIATAIILKLTQTEKRSGPI